MLAGTRRCTLCLVAFLASSVAGSEVWNEVGDAGSFPDAAAQVTRGARSLTAIHGSTSLGDGDLRDAYCVRIDDPGAFLATTDPSRHPDAAGAFDTRLFLFRKDGSPVLANDDTPPSSAPFLSTLTGAATDGSGFVLGQPGDYVLVIAGLPEDPEDVFGTDLFLFDPVDVVARPHLAAGAFHRWEGGSPVGGGYSIALAGVRPCQAALDAAVSVNAPGEPVRRCLGRDGGSGFGVCAPVGGFVGEGDDVAFGDVNGDRHLDLVYSGTDRWNYVCLGDGSGRVSSCDSVELQTQQTSSIALGFVDGDEYLDAVFGNLWEANRVCLGDGTGQFTCSPVEAVANTTLDVALGYVDLDAHLDVVFGNSFEADRVCFGLGSGEFVGCTDLPGSIYNTSDLKLGDLNGDGFLDAVFADYVEPSRVCLGDGFGFPSCTEIEPSILTANREVALGDLNGDTILDAVFATYSLEPDRVCLGDGQGGLACSSVSADDTESTGVALGLVNDDEALDAVFAAEALGRVCFGDGNGGFASCSDLTGSGHGSAVALGELDSASVFADGFESGDLAAWSSTAP